MSERKTGGSSGGIGFVGLLTIVFITLKLIGVISWSWWWVLSPLWIATSLFVLILGCLGLFIAFCHYMHHRQMRQKASAK
jgi:phosphoglycerol transferase MdoB-like AlkP superfamily enzyme